MIKTQKTTSKFLLLVLLAATVTGCSVNTSDNHPMESEDTAFRIRHAKNFDIRYMADGIKLVTDSEGRKLLLVPKGISVPAGYDEAVLVTTPIARAMYSSTTQVSYLDAFANDTMYDSIVAVTMPREEWTIPQVLKRFDSGQITSVEQNMTTPGNIEQIMGIAPQLVFSGGGDTVGARQRTQFDAVGIDYAIVTDWLETGTEASFEWIKFFAAFFNLDEEADTIFETRIARLNELKRMAASIPENRRPVMAYVLIQGGTVYTQSGESILAREMEQAGCIYAFRDIRGTGSIRITMEEFVNRCKDADIIIHGSLPQYYPDKAALLAAEPLFAEFKAFKNDRIFSYADGYYMNAARIIEKFEDALHMFHPDRFPEHKLLMYRRLPDTQR